MLNDGHCILSMNDVWWTLYLEYKCCMVDIIFRVYDVVWWTLHSEYTCCMVDSIFRVYMLYGGHCGYMLCGGIYI